MHLHLKYSITLSSFRGIEPLEKTLERLSVLKYRAVEMYGEPADAGRKKLTDVFHSFDLKVSGVTGMWGTSGGAGNSRMLLTTDPSLQRRARNYVKKCVEMCQELGGSYLNVCIFADKRISIYDRTHRVIPERSKAKGRDTIRESLLELARFAADCGVGLFVEPLNRYSTPYCCNAGDAVKTVKIVDHENLGMMLDTFHMNIEEDSFRNAIVGSKGLLRHMHFADNNRKMPGYGHIDFREIMAALQKVGYDEFITFEPTLENKEYDQSLRKGLRYIRSLA